MRTRNELKIAQYSSSNNVRKIVVQDGIAFYQSTGDSSGNPGVWFPFFGVGPDKTLILGKDASIKKMLEDDSLCFVNPDENMDEIKWSEFATRFGERQSIVLLQYQSPGVLKIRYLSENYPRIASMQLYLERISNFEWMLSIFNAGQKWLSYQDVKRMTPLPKIITNNNSYSNQYFNIVTLGLEGKGQYDLNVDALTPFEINFMMTTWTSNTEYEVKQKYSLLKQNEQFVLKKKMHDACHKYRDSISYGLKAIFDNVFKDFRLGKLNVSSAENRFFTFELARRSRVLDSLKTSKINTSFSHSNNDSLHKWIEEQGGLTHNSLHDPLDLFKRTHAYECWVIRQRLDRVPVQKIREMLQNMGVQQPEIDYTMNQVESVLSQQINALVQGICGCIKGNGQDRLDDDILRRFDLEICDYITNNEITALNKVIVQQTTNSFFKYNSLFDRLIQYFKSLFKCDRVSIFTEQMEKLYLINEP